MDVHCSSYGEAWDTYHLRHDAILLMYRASAFNSLPPDPSCTISLNELLYAFPTCQRQPERPALALQAHVNIEEWTAVTLANCPLAYELKRAGVGRKLEFVAVREFSNAPLQRNQLCDEFIKVTLPLFRSERQAVAREG